MCLREHFVPSGRGLTASVPGWRLTHPTIKISAGNARYVVE